MISKLLIEQHFHGAYGIDFNRASVDEVIEVANRIKKEGVGGIFPTLVTDTLENTQKQIKVIKDAAQKQGKEGAKILGIHLEGIFINKEKKGIHDFRNLLAPTIENFKKVADEFVKIVTLAPELCKKTFGGENLISYLKKLGIKVQAGHCLGADIGECDGVTHLFNAMGGISHKERSSSLSALLNDNIYTEIIGDGVHVIDDALELAFRMKPADKILLVSDALPCAHSDIKKFTFANEDIFFNGVKATSEDGTLAGSTKLLPDIIKILAKKVFFNPIFIDNPYRYHKIDIPGSLEWDEAYNIVKVND